MPRPYVIYYGWLADEDGRFREEAQRIAQARVPLLIAAFRAAPPSGHVNLNPQVLSRLHAAGTHVFAYADTNYGAVLAADVLDKVKEALGGGVDGVFFDRTPSSPDATALAYYSKVSAPAREAGKRVIANPGVAQISKDTLRFADHIMLEHRWRHLAIHSPWTAAHPPETFMGVSSNEEQAMGYTVDAKRAIVDTRQCWKQLVGWHTSTDLYRELPSWFEDYMDAFTT